METVNHLPKGFNDSGGHGNSRPPLQGAQRFRRAWKQLTTYPRGSTIQEGMETVNHLPKVKPTETINIYQSYPRGSTVQEGMETVDHLPKGLNDSRGHGNSQPPPQGEADGNNQHLPILVDSREPERLVIFLFIISKYAFHE